MKNYLRMRNRLLATFIFSLILSPIFSQVCGVTHQDQKQWKAKYQDHISNFTGSNHSVTDVQIPISLHLVAKTNGVGRARVETALKVLCELNELYLDSGIQFYLTFEGINFIDHDGIFDESHLIENEMAMVNEKKDSCINIFILNSVGAGNVVALYDNQQDWVVLQKSVFTQGDKTLAHEIGHFFALFHPHFGWDGQAWDLNIHGNPSPEIASNGQTPTEKVNGSNCNTAGDFLCDTPPDYNFGITWQQSCNYDGEAQDPNGEVVNPDETLIMSYFSDSCRNSFSTLQIEIMQADVEHESRAYLQTSYTPSALPIESNTELIAPIELIETTDNLIDFDWEDVSNAEYYYIEIDRSPDFNLDPLGQLTTESSVSINHDWIAGIKYYWRVISWNELDFCSQPFQEQEFSVEMVTSNSSINIDNYFNIRNTAKLILLDYKIAQSEEFIISLYSVDGQLVESYDLYLLSGKNTQQINLPIYLKGIYFITCDKDLTLNKLIFIP